MSIEIIPINGKCDFFDYQIFEDSLKNIIGKNCSEAKIFIFNNFPVSVSVETNIDLILIIAIAPKDKNYYKPKWTKDRAIYFHNQIIPIKFVTKFQNDTISIDDNNQIVANEEYVDYSSEINSMRFSLISYLSNKCGLKKEDLYVHRANAHLFLINTLNNTDLQLFK